MGDALIPSDWEGDYRCYCVKWPYSRDWEAVLRGVLTLPSRGRYWDEGTGRVTDAQSVIKSVNDYNLRLEECVVCGEGISQALAAIANAIASQTVNVTASAVSNCSQQNTISIEQAGISGQVHLPNGEVQPIYGTQPPLAVSPGSYPDGYENREQYDADKCQVANLLVDDLYQTLIRIGAIDVFSIVALTGVILACLVGLITVPVAAIPVMMAVLVQLQFVMYSVTLLATQIRDNREDWVCALYQSDNVEAAIAAISDLLDVAVSMIQVSSFVGQALKTLALVLLNSNTLNALFEKRAHISYQLADCSNCEDEDCHGILVETGTEDNGVYYSHYNEQTNWHFLIFLLNTYDIYPNTVHCGPEGQVVMSIQGANIIRYELRDSQMNVIYDSPTPRYDLCARRWSIVSTTPFSMTVDNVIDC